MKEIEKRTVVHRTLMHEFDEFVYIEKWENNRLRDNYFCYAGEVYPNGQPKNGARKYFYSRESGEAIQKEVEAIRDPSKFKWFDKLYYFDELGAIIRIDGEPAENCDYLLTFGEDAV